MHSQLYRMHAFQRTRLFRTSKTNLQFPLRHKKQHSILSNLQYQTYHTSEPKLHGGIGKENSFFHSHGHSHGGHSHEEIPQDKRAQRITWIGLWVNVGLTFMKGGVGFLSGSSALVADAIHSASDLVSDGVALVSINLSRRPKDETQPYGYGHYESLGTLAVALLLIGAGIGTGEHALEHLTPLLNPNVESEPIKMVSAAIACAGLSVVAKEVLYRQTVKIGTELHSSVLIANAWHHRSDALSSIVALIGVGGSAVGMPYLDPVGGLLVAGMVVKTGAQIGWDAMEALTDRHNESEMALIEKVEAMGQKLAEDTRFEIRDFHDIRCRRLGHYRLVDLHMNVNPRISVTAAYQAGNRVERLIKEEFPEISEVFVHVEAGKINSGLDTIASGVSFASVSGHQEQMPFGAGSCSRDKQQGKDVSRPQFEIEDDIHDVVTALNLEDVKGLSHFQVHYLHKNVNGSDKVLLGVEVNVVMESKLNLGEAEQILKQVHDSILEDIEYIDYVDIHLEIGEPNLGIWDPNN